MKKLSVVTFVLSLAIVVAAIVSGQRALHANIDSAQPVLAAGSGADLIQIPSEHDCVAAGFFFTSFPAKCVNAEGKLVSPESFQSSGLLFLGD